MVKYLGQSKFFSQPLEHKNIAQMSVSVLYFPKMTVFMVLSVLGLMTSEVLYLFHVLLPRSL